MDAEVEGLELGHGHAAQHLPLDLGERAQWRILEGDAPAARPGPRALALQLQERACTTRLGCSDC